MLEKPDFPEEKVIACLESEYGLQVKALDFLPLGADLNTAVFRVTGQDDRQFFLKLRRGDFFHAGAAVPGYLSELGIQQIIPPLTTQSGQLTSPLPPYTVILFPFVSGQHGFDKPLSSDQWVDFGAAVKRFHSAAFPSQITAGIPREDYSPRWCSLVRNGLKRVFQETFDDPLALELAAFLKNHAERTSTLIYRAEYLAGLLRGQPRECILCHGDMHAWNLLVVDQVTFYIVDWDTLIFAPKERDLMFIGAGFGGGAFSLEQEAALFYQGYGAVELDAIALAYYRYERIIEDIAVFCQQILSVSGSREDRAQSLDYFKSNYLPGGTIDLADALDKTALFKIKRPL